MVDDQAQRAAVYIDGFNLYHPIREMNENFLKWNSLWKLSENLAITGGYRLVKVVFCTAVPSHLPHSRDRHNIFNRAQEAQGVVIIKGHHVFDETAKKHSEKQSDINVAVELLFDGEDDVYDVAYLISADSDQAATARKFVERLGPRGKTLISVAPPNRRPPEKMRPYAQKAFSLSKHDIETTVMDAFELGTSGRPIRRPPAYDPPDWWIHPKNRR